MLSQMDLPAIGEGEEAGEEEMRIVEEDAIIEEKDEESQLARGQFQLQCDRLIEGIISSSRDVNELIAVYNQINNSFLPVSVKLTLGLLCSRLFRSMGDLDDTACELSRLIELYSAPWDGRAEALRRLHAQYRRNCRLLNAAIRKLHFATAGSEQYRTTRLLNKWEQLFSVAMLAKGIGRRWKFKLPALRKAASKGPDAVETYLATEYVQPNIPTVRKGTEERYSSKGRDSDLDGGASLVSSTTIVEDAKTIEQEEEGEKEEEEEEDEDSEISEIDESKFASSKMKSPDEKGRKSVRFRDEGEEEGENAQIPANPRPLMWDAICWTHEPEHVKHIVVRLSRPSGLRIATGNKDGRYVLRPAPFSATAWQSTALFAMGVAAMTSGNANAPIGDFIVDTAGELPEEAQIELDIGDRPVAVGSINLRQLGTSDLSPIVLPDAKAPIPTDCPFAINVTLPLYSTSLGTTVRVAVGTLPVSIFGISYDIPHSMECATETEVVEEKRPETPEMPPIVLTAPVRHPKATTSPKAVTPTSLSPKSSQQPSPQKSAAASPVPPEKPTTPVSAVTPPRRSAPSTPPAAALVPPEVTPPPFPVESQCRPVSSHSIGLSPIPLEILEEGSPIAVEVLVPEAVESMDELRRRFLEEQHAMAQTIKTMEAEIQKLRQRQAECDHCSGRERLYGIGSSDARFGRAGSKAERTGAGTRTTGTITGTPVPSVRYAASESIIRDRSNDSLVTLPAIFMPSPLGHAYNARAANYFHPIGHAGRRVTQPPSMFAMQVPSSSTVNLYSLAVRQSEQVVNDQRLKLAPPTGVPQKQQEQKS